jgi:hypothetical protein
MRADWDRRRLRNGSCGRASDRASLLHVLARRRRRQLHRRDGVIHHPQPGQDQRRSHAPARLCSGGGNVGRRRDRRDRLRDQQEQFQRFHADQRLLVQQLHELHDEYRRYRLTRTARSFTASSPCDPPAAQAESGPVVSGKSSPKLCQKAEASALIPAPPQYLRLPEHGQEVLFLGSEPS